MHDDGGIYDGEWLDKKKHGHGCYKYPSGSTYEGQWRNNVKEGLGGVHARSSGCSVTPASSSEERSRARAFGSCAKER